jgi:lysophospholipase L1-like esterase
MRCERVLSGVAALLLVACGSSNDPEDGAGQVAAPAGAGEGSEMSGTGLGGNAGSPPVGPGGSTSEPGNTTAQGGNNVRNDAGKPTNAGGSSSDPSAANDAAPSSDGSTADAIDLVGYNPCPAVGTPCAIMPLGDSITLGLGAWTGYRGPLFHLANVDSKSMTYVGSLLDGPDTVDNKPFPKSHEGHSGYTIDGGGGRDGIKAIVVDVMNRYRPQIITMMIGTNDIDTGDDNVPTRLAGLIDTILAADPKVLLVVAQIVPTADDAENLRVQAFNVAIPGLVQARARMGQHVTWVDMYTPFVANPNFKTEYLVDRLHPRGPGYEIMAKQYYAVVGPLLR